MDEVAVEELGTKVRLHESHFGEQLFAKVGDTKHGHDGMTLSLCWKIFLREGQGCGKRIAKKN